MQKTQKATKKSETQNVETHEIIRTANRFRSQTAQAQKDFNDPEKSIFWTSAPGTKARLNVYEACMRSQSFTINNETSQYDVIDLKGINQSGMTKITSFPSFVLRTATAIADILDRHDASVMSSEPVGEDVAFADRPWISLKEPFEIEAMFANVKGVSRIVHIREIEATASTSEVEA